MADALQRRLAAIIADDAQRRMEVALHLGWLATRGTITEPPPIRRKYGRSALGMIGMAIIVLALTALVYGWR